MRRFIWLPLAGALLTGGAAVGAAAPGLVGETTESVVELPARPATLVAEVLSDLVEQGVISQEQADTISAALDERVAEERAAWEARREEVRERLEQLRGFLDDDVITADEVASLPDGGLKAALETLLVDDQITREQLRHLRGLIGGHLDGPSHHLRGRPGFAPPAPWSEWPSDQQSQPTDRVDGSDATPGDAASGLQDS